MIDYLETLELIDQQVEYYQSIGLQEYAEGLALFKQMYEQLGDKRLDEMAKFYENKENPANNS